MSEIFGVVGSGTMGNGIAQVAARAGFQVVMRDVAEDFLARGMQSVNKSLQRDVDKERLTAEAKQSIVGRIRTTTDLADLRDTFIIVEAVTEDLQVKTEVFKALDGITNGNAILASNTSSISITKLGAVTKRPDKVIGMHVCLAIMNVLHDGFGESKYRPCPLLKRYVDAGWLGKKSGRGFYEY